MVIKVMLVEDHVVVREGLKALLAAEEDVVIVGEASTGEEALEVAARTDPQVVVMDLRLPRMSGIEATRALRQAFPNLGVVVLSMYDDENTILRALKAGASGYVLKRAGVSQLVEAIRLVAQGEVYLDPAVSRRVVEGLQRTGVGGGRTAEEEGPELTPGEQEILRLVAKGLTNAEIARRLFISVKTVQAHRANLMKKLGVHDRVDLVKYALRKGFWTLEEEKS
ncbi:MAG: response regulator transcription factor [Thermoanaerobacteraceae bacterium]|nr:response regulator transcription factor [Thermoanaerobacteraceae bacterium]